MQRTSKGETIAELRERTLSSARKAYGHIEGANDVDMLCLSLSAVEHNRIERLEALNCNAAQAMKIAELERR